MTRIRVYLAGSISRRPEIRELANRLRGLGFDVTSRWLVETGPNLAYTDYPLDVLAKHAVRDLVDITRADALVYVANEADRPSKGGGRHFETGFAWGLEKPVVVFGRREHVFHALPGVKFAEEEAELVSRLEELEQERRAALIEWTEEHVEQVYDKPRKPVSLLDLQLEEYRKAYEKGRENRPPALTSLGGTTDVRP